ncbi:DNA helicase PIF1, ATP-dependent [Corchorus olitorius]|uniref:ATP-dependent DNA helicase n=1 Tax=Corchorus olitorius TaxID=93759 RepID=A0A1R3FW31_9ROSI|nr:DNA helicase PIF1, ATP-dependent [Corchorus olitorius]
MGRKRRVVSPTPPEPRTRQRKGSISDITPVSSSQAAYNRYVRRNRRIPAGGRIYDQSNHESPIADSQTLSHHVPHLPAVSLGHYDQSISPLSCISAPHLPLFQPPRITLSDPLLSPDLPAASRRALAAAKMHGSDVEMSELDSHVEFPNVRVDHACDHQFWEEALSQYQGLLAHHDGLIGGVAIAIDHILSDQVCNHAVDNSHIDSQKFDNVGNSGVSSGGQCGDQFWEEPLLQDGELLADHHQPIDGIAVNAVNNVLDEIELPVVSKVDALSNRFRRKLYLAGKAHTLYRQERRMTKSDQALQSRSKLFNHIAIRSTVTSEGDLKTLKRVQVWSDDVRVSILSRFSDSSYEFICDHTVGTSRAPSRPQYFVSTGNLVINEVADDSFTYPQIRDLQPGTDQNKHGSPIRSDRDPMIVSNQIPQLTTTHQRTVYEPAYFGGPDRKCSFCEAHMWYGERCDISKHTDNPVFNLCCRQGTIRLPASPPTPPILDRFLNYQGGNEARNFRERLRIYNSLFQFTSFGAKIDRAVNSRRGPFVFCVNGLTYHRIGSMLPIEGTTPKFAQLYVYDTQNEVQNRVNAVCGDPHSDAVDHQVVAQLSEMLDQTNEIVKVYRTARERLAHSNGSRMRIRFIEAQDTDDHAYAAPAGSEITVLIVGQNDEVTEDRDIIIDHRSDGLKRISTLHPLYMPFQYPLLFPHGEDGFHLGIPYANSRIKRAPKRGRLLQQYIGDAFSSVDRSRLFHVKSRQKELRSDRYTNVRDAICRGDIDGSDVGKRIVLPVSYTGAPRYMFQNYQDAMAICRAYGYPTLFITFTCNPNWKEIDDALKMIPGQRPEDRPDLVSRVFRLKVRDLMHDLLEGAFFGTAIAGIYTIEFQKRGLPHAHILLWLHPDSKWRTVADIDRIISAELPDPEVDRVGYDAVSTSMMHGPCGAANSKAPCMHKGHCSKYYPMSLQPCTFVDESSFPVYRRRDTSYLQERGPTAAIKYLFKYIHKGPDRARVVVEEDGSEQPVEQEPEMNDSSANIIDEVKLYLDVRYVAAHEACWRLFEFDIHFRQPSVQRLLIHLPGQQNIYFQDRQSLERVLANQISREQCSQNGLRSTKYLRKPELCCTLIFQLSGYGTGMIRSGQGGNKDKPLGGLFLSIFSLCHVANPSELFERNWRLFSDDIQRKFRTEMRARNYRVPERDLRNYVLIALEDILLKNCSSLAEMKLPQPIHRSRVISADRLIHEELNCDVDALREQYQYMLNLLNSEQKVIHDHVIDSVLQKKPTLFFVYGYGGTGKTFMWNTIIAGIRSKGLIVLAVVSSGIASLLMLGGRTAHSRFKIPVDIDEYSTCGDFRQILPVIPRGTKGDILGAAITNSALWPLFKVYTLNTNMRLQRPNMSDEYRKSLEQFGQWLLDVGDGSAQSIDEAANNQDESTIRIPKSLLVAYEERAIITPYNDTAAFVNAYALGLVPGPTRTYYSYDALCKSSQGSYSNDLLHSPEMLNSLRLPGVPDHELNLKIGAVVMLLRNVNQAAGLCNGTRLVITQMAMNVVEARVMTATGPGEKVYIPRISFTMKDKKWPFTVNRRQFPFKLCICDDNK